MSGQKLFCLMLLSLFMFTVANGETLVTKSGKTYNDYKVTNVHRLGIQITHADGITLVLFSDLPEDIALAYSPDLKIQTGIEYKNYSIVKVTHNKVKITHKEGTAWLLHSDLPEPILKKYATEIKQKKKLYAEKKLKQDLHNLEQRRHAEFPIILRNAARERNEEKAIAIIEKLIESTPKHPDIQKARDLLGRRRTDLAARTLIEKAQKFVNCSDAIDLLENTSQLPPNRYSEYVQRLLKSLREFQKKGMTSIYAAITENDTHWIDLLLKNGTNINDLTCNTPPLVFSVSNKTTKESTISHLISRGADVNIQEKDSGYTPLIVACFRRDAKIAEMLLKAGANVNKASFSKVTPLHSAIARNDDTTFPLVILLKRYKADTSLRDKNGITVQMLAKNLKNSKKKERLLFMLGNSAVSTTTEFISFNNQLIHIDWTLTAAVAKNKSDLKYVEHNAGYRVFIDSNGIRFNFDEQSSELVYVSARLNKRKHYDLHTVLKKNLDFFKRRYGKGKFVLLSESKSDDELIQNMAVLANSCAIVLGRSMLRMERDHAGVLTGIAGTPIRMQQHHDMLILNPAYFPTDREFLLKVCRGGL